MRNFKNFPGLHPRTPMVGEEYRTLLAIPNGAPPATCMARGPVTLIRNRAPKLDFWPVNHWCSYHPADPAAAGGARVKVCKKALVFAPLIPLRPQMGARWAPPILCTIILKILNNSFIRQKPKWEVQNTNFSPASTFAHTDGFDLQNYCFWRNFGQSPARAYHLTKNLKCIKASVVIWLRCARVGWRSRQ